jgi:hypothetical protein
LLAVTFAFSSRKFPETRLWRIHAHRHRLN